MMSQYRPLVLAAMLAFAIAASADPAPFDLAGPNLDVTVTRGGKTLPIAEVPNLAAGDRLWIKADLPADAVRALSAWCSRFLSGSTNPPPPELVLPLQDLDGQMRARTGLTVTVPEDAQQVLVFLAPETGGDFKTLVDAVRGRPGAFVRTSQDLNQAALDRSRLETLSRRHPLAERCGSREAAGGRAAARAQPRHQGGREMPGADGRSCRRPV